MALLCRSGVSIDIEQLTLTGETPALHSRSSKVLAEQFVGQHLAYLGPGKPSIHYWLREEKKENAQVDYVVAAGEKISPVEVKAGAAGSLKSLHQFCLEKKSTTALRLDLNKPSRFPLTFKARDGAKTAEVHFELLSLPLYAVESLGSL